MANANNTIKLTDFDDRVDIFPISNPDIFSQSQRIAMAQEMMQLVQSNPEVHGIRYLRVIQTYVLCYRS